MAAPDAVSRESEQEVFMTFQKTIRQTKPTMAGMTGPRRKSEARNREQLPSFSDGPTLTRGTSGSTLRCTPVSWGSAPTGAFCPWTLSTLLTKPDSRVWQGSVYRSCHELISILLAFHNQGSVEKVVFSTNAQSRFATVV